MYATDLTEAYALYLEWQTITDRLSKIESAKTVAEIVDLIEQSGTYEELRGTPLRDRKNAIESRLAALGVTLDAPAPAPAEPAPAAPADAVPVSPAA